MIVCNGNYPQITLCLSSKKLRCQCRPARSVLQPKLVHRLIPQRAFNTFREHVCGGIRTSNLFDSYPSLPHSVLNPQELGINVGLSYPLCHGTLQFHGSMVPYNDAMVISRDHSEQPRQLSMPLQRLSKDKYMFISLLCHNHQSRWPGGVT